MKTEEKLRARHSRDGGHQPEEFVRAREALLTAFAEYQAALARGLASGIAGAQESLARAHERYVEIKDALAGSARAPSRVAEI